MKNSKKFIFLIVLLLVIPVFSLLAINYKQASEKVENLEEYKGETLAVGSNGVVGVHIDCPTTVTYQQTVTCHAGASFSGGQTGSVSFHFSVSGSLGIVSQSGSTVTIRGLEGTGGSVNVVEIISGASSSSSIQVIGFIGSATISPDSLTIERGDSKSIYITTSPSSGQQYVDINYTIANGTSANVIKESNSSLRITGAQNGITDIHVYAINRITGETLADKKITVNVITSPQNVHFNSSSYSVNVGATQATGITISPTDTSNPKITYTSTNTNIATINSSGVITGKGNGTTTIRVSVCQEYGDFCVFGTATVTVTTKVTGVTISPTSATIYMGETKTFTATLTPPTASNKNVTWSSSNTNVATVDQNGKVTPKANGTTTITVRTNDGNYTASAQVTVKTKVTGITVSPTSATINMGETKTFTATISPSTASNKTVNWTSSNTNVATVDSNGKVTPKANGTTTITATSAENSSIKASATVTVQTKVTGVTISPTSATINMGETKTFTATISPSTASNKNVNWTSSNTNVATVDSTGKVTPKANGTATITATSAENSSIKASATITVQTKVTGVTISPTSATIYMGETKIFTATVSPSTATNKTVTWTSTNTSVATVDSNGKVTPKANGTTTIKVTTADGSKTASASVTVRTNATGVTLNKTSTIIEVGKTETLSATVTPSTTSDKTITWSSANTSVATVDSNGKVTAVSNGETDIIARTTNGITARCRVNVVTSVDGIHLSKTSTELKPDQTETLTYVIYPSTASNQSVTWSSNNTSVATVSNGVITAKAPGTAIITVKTADGSKQDQCTVKVITPVTRVKLNKNSTVLAVGQTDTFSATITPSGATYKGVSWSSSNASVATVSDEGVVTAVSAGQAEITVTTDEGGKTDVATVTVYVPVDGIHLSEEELSIPKGGTATLSYSIYPSTASNQNVTWSSSKIEVATISDEGVITAKEPGTTIITVTTADGSKSASATVTVTQPVEGVVLVKKEIYLDLNDTTKAKYEILPKNATNKNVTWTSSDNEIVVIESDGTIKPLKTGEVTLTVETEDGSFKDTAIVYVQVLVQSVSVKDDDIYVKPGKEIKLDYEITPSNATDKKLKWKSSNEKVATVDQNGVVKSISLGTATIIATDSAGVEYEVLTVNVTKSGTDNPDTGITTPLLFVIGLIVLLFVMIKLSKKYKTLKKL